MILLELFQYAYPWKWISKFDDSTSAAFTTNDGSQVSVRFSSFHDYEMGDRTWEIVFLRSIGAYSKTSGITGQGDAYRVFATLYEIMKEFITDYKPEKIFFNADEPSRQKLYRRMAERLGQELNMKVDIWNDEFYLTKRWEG